MFSRSKSRWLATPMTLAAALAGTIGCQSAPALNSTVSESASSSASARSYENDPLPSSQTALTSPPQFASVVSVAYQEASDEPTAIRFIEEIPSSQSTVANALTLEQLEQMALDASPAIAAARARVQALRGKWVQTGLAPNPTIGYLSDDVGDDGKAGKQGGFAGRQFVTGNKLGLNRAVVAQEIAKAEQDWAAYRQRVLTDVRIGYYDVLIAQQKLDLSHELVKVSEQAVEATKALVEARESSVIGLLQTEVEAQNAQILVRRATNEVEAVWRRLSSILGRCDLAPQRLEGNLDETESELHWDEQLQRLVTQSPEMAATVAEVERARWALNRAYAEVKPDIDVQVALQYDDATGDTVGGVQVGFPIPLWNKNQGGIQQAQGDITAARRDMEQVELSLQHRLATIFQDYQDARYQVTQYADTVLPKTQRAYDLVSQGYKSGEVGYLDLLTAQKTYFQTNLSYVESLRKMWEALIQIDGLLLSDSLASKARP